MYEYIAFSTYISHCFDNGDIQNINLLHKKFIRGVLFLAAGRSGDCDVVNYLLFYIIEP